MDSDLFWGVLWPMLDICFRFTFLAVSNNSDWLFKNRCCLTDGDHHVRVMSQSCNERMIISMLTLFNILFSKVKLQKTRKAVFVHVRAVHNLHVYKFQRLVVSSYFIYSILYYILYTVCFLFLIHKIHKISYVLIKKLK